MADNAPLFKTISRYVNEAMLADLAKAYDEGRLLLIGTADLDAQQGDRGMSALSPRADIRARWTPSAASCSPPPPFPARSRRPCST